MLTLLLALQDDEAPTRLDFGDFMQLVPHWGFVLIHSTLILLAFFLSRKARVAGYGTASSGFLLFILAELSYITYHIGLTHFLFAHTIAEVLDALAFVMVAVGLAGSARRV
jgi:hypothetical protein